MVTFSNIKSTQQHNTTQQKTRTTKNFTSYLKFVFPRSISKLPIILKGILHPEDAKLAATNGAAAVIVSNHGARQLDGVPASIDALPGKPQQVIQK